MIPAADAHIHLDMYEDNEVQRIIEELTSSPVKGLICVSRHRDSCIITQNLLRRYPKQIFAAYGFHPEQELPSDTELKQLLQWIAVHCAEMTAIGEVGLPYYMRQEAQAQGAAFELKPYVELLEQFLSLARSLHKPVVLHAVYEDADLVCDLLTKHGIDKAHFHWFKGSKTTMARMIAAEYCISITPDVLYESEIQELVASYPIELMMVETDGPWPFEGPFTGMSTHPKMILQVIEQIASIKQLSIEAAAKAILQTTRQFYSLDIQ
jgi:TatD DNase family protein